MTFHPMLAPSKSPKTDEIRYPVLASYKLDGVRATVQGGELLSRNLKPIPNMHVQDLFGTLPEGIDGELIAGLPTADDVFRQTTSIVMSDDKPADNVWFYVFDMHSNFLDERFEDRLANARYVTMSKGGVVLVKHVLIENEEQLLEMEKDAVDAGFEGLMLRDPNGPYKEGRATLKQGWLMKLKRFEDSEARIIGFHELMHNENEAKTNELGRTQRSSAKAGKVAGGVLGKFSVVDLTTGVEFEVGGGMKAAEREKFWKEQKQLLGKIIKYKHFPVGAKDRPRFPIWLGFRDERDM